MDSFTHNRLAWDAQAEEGNEWSQMVAPDVIAQARRGEWQVFLTPTRAVPRAWLGELKGRDVLGLGSGGGQQCPVFAAAGAHVTSFDASDTQLEQDRKVAARDRLELRTVQGDMRDLSAFADASFDVVFNPTSVVFVEDVQPVWRECARVLRPGGVLLSGFNNPWSYLFDQTAFDEGRLVVAHKLPYSDVSLPPDILAARIRKNQTVEFSHTLETLIGGQLEAGLLLGGFYEDEWSQWPALIGVAKPFLATRALKPAL